MARSSDSHAQVVSVGGHRIRLTNLDKVLYPETGTTKGEVIDYYARIAPVLIPYTRNRPATRKRWVHGTGTSDDPGQVFFQKNLDDSTPDWVSRQSLEHSDHSNDYPLVNNVATLTWLGQMAALEIHVPQWRFARDSTPKNPDRLVLDLDPGPGVGLAECAEVARLSRVILQGMGLEPLPVTSGSKGIHLYAALDGTQSSENVSAVAHELARALEADHPDLIVSDMKKSLREGKVLVDWSQNSANKTTIAPYSLRGRARPMVAAPRTWRELSSRTLSQLDFQEVLARVAAKGDLLAPLREGDGGTVEVDDAADTPAAGRSPDDRLQEYRSKRDGSKTPEPVPSGAAAASGGSIFVVQEHHASRLHWDFRLEHDGVLVSWALPKGVPTEAGRNHLAVQTEDHPIEYATFSGDIPAAEYGGGHVDIWDSGEYRLEKWREGKEIIVTLDSAQRGARRYALIHTGGSGARENQWLIHLMKPAGDATLSSRGTDAAARRPYSQGSIPKPMLATLGAEKDFDVDGAFDDEADWSFEMKWDGIRSLARVDPDAAEFSSRNGLSQTAAFPELQALASAGVDVVVDGEIVALGRDGRPDFGLLQSRSGITGSTEVARARKATPVHYMIFDILEKDGVSLLDAPQSERRRILESTISSKGPIQVPPAFDGNLSAALASSRELGLEGVVAKQRDAPYSPGRRSSAWIKLKHHRSQEVVIGGWRPGTGRRSERIGSLLVAVPDIEGGELIYAGRVGSGFTESQLDSLLATLERSSRKTTALTGVPAADARDAHWVTPRLVGEVEFAEWTSTGRLRQPRWKGLREDKGPADVRFEGPRDRE